MCGGSHKLIIRLGAVSSPDTHDRYVADMAQLQRSKTVWHDLTDNIFTVASADNIDILQSHASVYHSEQSRGYHAVTIQISHPNPEICLQDNTQTLKRSIGDSPSKSLHNLGKIGPKRLRTLIPRKLVEQIQTAKTLQGVVCNQGTSANPVPDPPTPTLSIDGFIEKPSEKIERESLESEVLVYTLLKDSHQGASNKVVCEFNDIFSYTTQDSVNKSNIYYGAG